MLKDDLRNSRACLLALFGRSMATSSCRLSRCLVLDLRTTIPSKRVASIVEATFSKVVDNPLVSSVASNATQC